MLVASSWVMIVTDTFGTGGVYNDGGAARA
jgi:hypothetical protein